MADFDIENCRPIPIQIPRFQIMIESVLKLHFPIKSENNNVKKKKEYCT